MKRSEYEQLKRKVADLRAHQAQHEGETVPESAVFLEGELAKSTNPQERAALYQLLCDEYALCGLHGKELEKMRLRAREYLEEPVPWASLASRLCHEPGKLDEARNASEHAVSIAKTSNRFVRYALIARARVAVVQQDWELLADTLQELIDDAENIRAEDVGYESDFLESVAGMVAPGLVKRYLSIARR